MSLDRTAADAPSSPPPGSRNDALATTRFSGTASDNAPDAAVPDAAPRDVDVLIIGAGPVGLFAAFQAGVLGLSCEIVEALDEPGGQCTELYPDKPIYDIPALPVCTARELVSRLLEQARPFGAAMHLGQQAISLQPLTADPALDNAAESPGQDEDATRNDAGIAAHAAIQTGHVSAEPASVETAAAAQRRDAQPHRIAVRTDRGLTFHAAAVLLCAGNGAFVPQRVSGPASALADQLEGHSVHYAVRDIERFRNERVVIAGGGDAALDWALALRDVAATLTLIHRRDAFRAADGSVAALREAVARGEITLKIGTIGELQTSASIASDAVVTSDDSDAAAAGSPPTLASITVKQRDGDHTVPADHLLVLYGLVAALGPINHWGLEIAGGRTSVDPLHYETSMPRVYAAGDIAGYGNKQKLILSGFHEAALALRHAYRYARPDTSRTHIHSSYDARLAALIQPDAAPSDALTTP